MIFVGRLKTQDFPGQIFFAAKEPTEKTFGNRYRYVIGPFETIQGAEFMAKYGWNNPHCQHVDDAERLAKQERN